VGRGPGLVRTNVSHSQWASRSKEIRDIRSGCDSALLVDKIETFTYSAEQSVLQQPVRMG